MNINDHVIHVTEYLAFERFVLLQFIVNVRIIYQTTCKLSSNIEL